jgi:hypothetical protein
MLKSLPVQAECEEMEQIPNELGRCEISVC